MPIKLSEQVAFHTRPKNEDYMLTVMDKPSDEASSSQRLQTNKKQIKVAVTLLYGFNGIFGVTNKHNKFFFVKTLIIEDFEELFFQVSSVWTWEFE